MKKLLLLAAITLTASLSAIAAPECNPWASTATEKTTVKTEKPAEVQKDSKPTESAGSAHHQAHIKAISNQRVNR